MEVIELCNYVNNVDVTKGFFFTSLLRSCRNLLSLSPQNTMLYDHDDHFDAKEIFEAVRLFRNLKFLHLDYVVMPKKSRSRIDLSRIISDLPNLRHLNVSRSDFICSDPDLPKLNLECLGAVDIKDENVLKIPSKVLVSSKTQETLGSLLVFLENASAHNHSLFPGIRKLNAFLSKAFDEEQPKPVPTRMEEGILCCIDMNYKYLPKGIIGTLSKLKSSQHLSPEFWAKLIRNVASYDLNMKLYEM